jgi:hypothetical protein
MKIKVNNVSLCRTGGVHVQFDLLINNTITGIIKSSTDREIGIILMHGEYTKAGATTLAQKKVALLNKEFEW